MQRNSLESINIQEYIFFFKILANSSFPSESVTPYYKYNNNNHNKTYVMSEYKDIYLILRKTTLI